VRYAGKGFWDLVALRHPGVVDRLSIIGSIRYSIARFIHNAGGKLSTTSGRTTNMKQCVCVETNKRKSIVKRRESSDINEYKETRAKGQVIDNLWKGDFEEL